MTKVKSIFSDSTDKFENEINDFIKDKKVIDIKYTTHDFVLGMYQFALVIYEED